jgi:UDP-N-acetyl-D-glucosamine dehydrogenase
MNNIKKLQQLFKSKDAIIGIIGLGYVGLPLALNFVENKFITYGFDIDKNKIKKLNSGRTYIKHINSGKITDAINNGLIATDDFNKISSVDVIIICVPTPLGVHNEPDLSYVENTLGLIEPHLVINQLLILESTTYPGTTEEILVPFIESIKNSKSQTINQKFTLGVNFFLGYSPEREDPGNKNFTTKTIPKVVSGHTQNCLQLTDNLYKEIVEKTVPVSSTKVAEMTKILENIHRAVNIGLVNEMKLVADKMDIDIYEVISAAASKPFGFTPYYPGPGLGGHCIPIDPFYLTWKAKEIGMNTRFIELAGEINSLMPTYVLQKVTDALNNTGKAIKGSNILLLGLSYKKNIDDLRESPSLELLDSLVKKGAKVSYSDPFFKSIPHTRKYQFQLSSQSLTKKTLQLADLVLISTDHDAFDYELIEKEAKLIVDTRGRIQGSKKVIRA